MKIISMALWGYGDMYWKSLPGCILSYRALFPDWDILVECDHGILDHPLAPLLVAMDKSNDTWTSGWIKIRWHFNCMDWGKCKRMLWRLEPIFDPVPERFICRDIDTIALARDRRRVDAWIRSGKACHATSDNPQHWGCALMGGMVGFRAREMREAIPFCSLSSMLNKAENLDPIYWNTHGADQDWMNRNLWPMVEGDVCEHRFDGGRMSNKCELVPVDYTAPIPDVSPAVQAEADNIGKYVGQAGFSGDDFRRWLELVPDDAQRLRSTLDKLPEARKWLAKWDMTI